MTDFGKRTGDMFKSTYDTDENGVVDNVDAVPGHKTSHQDGGSDEIDLTGLTPSAHKTTHEDGGSDEIDLTGLTGAASLVDRGDPSAQDFTVGDFTTDGAWHDLDLSAIIPAGTIAVIARLRLKDNAVGSMIIFRKKGNVNEINVSVHSTQVSALMIYDQKILFPDSDRIVEYKATNVTFNSITVSIVGWFL